MNATQSLVRTTHTLPMRLRRLLTAIVVGITATLALSAPPASAATTTSQSGWYGGVYSQGAFGQMVYQNTTYGLTAASGIRVFGPVVSRSNGSTGTQTLLYNIQIDRWDAASARWVVHTSDVYSTQAYMAPGQASLRFAERELQTGPGIFHVSFLIRWYDTATGRWLGSKLVGLTAAGDYTCRPSVISCQIGPGWIRL